MLTESIEADPRARQDERPAALIIGAGFGGLAAAIRLGARGYRAIVLERLDAPGGRAYTYEKNGFRFDGGPTIITAPFLFEDLWSLCGRRLADDIELMPVDPFYSIRFDDGSCFFYSGDPERMRAEVARFSPGDVNGYEQFMRFSRTLCEKAFEELGHTPFSTIGSMIRVAPDLVRLKGARSLHSVVSQFIRDPRLRIAFSFHPLLIGGNPFSASAIYGLIPHLERRWGVHYARGGTGAIVDGMTRLIAGQGGVIHYEADVEEILLERGRACGARLTTGEVLYADIVVSNADAATTYHDLLPAGAAKRWSAPKVARARHSMGLFVWYFGVEGRYDDVDHHTIVLGPRYEELLKDIFTRKTLAEDFSLYLHRPTRSDPSMAPDGCDAFYVLSPTPNLESDVDWEVAAEPYRRAIEKRLSETVLPGLGSRIVASQVMTPLDFQTRLRAFRGSGFSLEPILTQSAWFRPHNQCSDVRNLFLVGAGTHPGAGVPGVLSSAKVLDAVVPDAAAFQ